MLGVGAVAEVAGNRNDGINRDGLIVAVAGCCWGEAAAELGGLKELIWDLLEEQGVKTRVQEKAHSLEGERTWRGRGGESEMRRVHKGIGREGQFFLVLF